MNRENSDGIILNLARRRKTVRNFSKEKPPFDDVIRAIEAAKEAPSGMNSQPWHFVFVDDPDLKRRIREICEEAERRFHENVGGRLGKWLKETGITWEKPFLSDAPYLILVFGHMKQPFWIQSVWLSIGYVLLALEEKGLGTVTYTPPDARKIEKLLDVDEDWRLQVILPVGYPQDDKPKYERKPVNEVFSVNSFKRD